MREFNLIFFIWVVVAFSVCLGQSSDHPAKLAINPLDGQLYVWIPQGTFLMGCSADDQACQEMKPFENEKPRHRVTISKGFWIGQTEVTVGAYRKYSKSTERISPEELVLLAPEQYRDVRFPQSDNHPLAFVSWKDAEQYCTLAEGRLPTEAEWEYAARAGSNKARYGNLDEIAWFADNSGHLRLDSGILNDRQIRNQKLRDNENDTHPVKEKTPNDFGLYDMLGNVTEYCADYYKDNYYEVSVERDPMGPSNGEFWVIRGGEYSSRPLGVRVSRRSYMLPDHRFKNIGFRCVLETMPK